VLRCLSRHARRTQFLLLAGVAVVNSPADNVWLDRTAYIGDIRVLARCVRLGGLCTASLRVFEPKLQKSQRMLALLPSGRGRMWEIVVLVLWRCPRLLPSRFQ